MNLIFHLRLHPQINIFGGQSIFVGKTEKLVFFFTFQSRISVAVTWSVVLNNVDDQFEPFQTKYSSFYYKDL